MRTSTNNNNNNNISETKIPPPPPPSPPIPSTQTHLPQELHAVHVVLQQVLPANAPLLKVAKVRHPWPLVVRHTSPLVTKVEAVRVLALDQRVPFVEQGSGRRARGDTGTKAVTWPLLILILISCSRS